MAQLAIKGHPTRGKEVIQLLEMLGGKNTCYFGGDDKDIFYYIDEYRHIHITFGALSYILFDLEEFEKKFPYKVDDVVVNHKYGKGDITQMLWIDNEIVYEIHFEDCMAYCKANELCKYDAFKGLLLQELTEYLSHATREELDKTMEEIEIELAPFKVGDKVIVKCFEKMGDDEVIKVFKTYDGDIKYKTKNHLNTHYFMEDSLTKVEKSYKKETMEERGEKTVNHIFDTDVISFDIAQKDKYELDLQGKFEVVLREGKYYVERIQPQYPKDYKECCDTLYINSKHDEYYEACLQGIPIQTFAKLLICRNAYWKIAGEEMGLDEPWEPDWNNLSTTRAHLIINKGCFTYASRVLVFPTEEMRDAFFENFKDLINDCKELL